MKGFGIIGMAAIAGLIGYFCEPALRPVLTPEVKTPAKPVAQPAVVKPTPEPTAPPVVAEPEPPKTEPQVEPAPEPAPPAAEESAPVAEPEAPAEPETPAEPAPAQPEETAPEETTPAPSGKVELPPVRPLNLEPSTPVTPSETAETSPVIVAMQESFENDGLKEFAEASPTRWRTGTDETIGGETYQTGLLDYLAHTPFGGKAMQVKALLQDGKVVKWVSITSGKELK